jgi:hypothetical protein
LQTGHSSEKRTFDPLLINSNSISISPCC